MSICPLAGDELSMPSAPPCPSSPSGHPSSPDPQAPSPRGPAVQRSAAELQLGLDTKLSGFKKIDKNDHQFSDCFRENENVLSISILTIGSSFFDGSASSESTRAGGPALKCGLLMDIVLAQRDFLVLSTFGPDEAGRAISTPRISDEPLL